MVRCPASQQRTGPLRKKAAAAAAGLSDADRLQKQINIARLTKNTYDMETFR